MSYKEMLRRKVVSAVLRQAWRLFRRASSYGWALILKLSWRLVRNKTRFYATKAVGVTASCTARQARLKWLQRYRTEEIKLSLVRDPRNRYDENSVCILASIDGKTKYMLGYLKSGLASQVAPLLDSGQVAIALLEEVTGPGSLKLRGLNLTFAII